MSPPENKVIVQRLMEEGWNQRNFVVVEEIVGPEHVFHEPSGPQLGTGPEAYVNRMKLYAGALDTHFTIEDLIAEADRVVVRWTVRGRHNLELTGITIHRFEAGKILESWGNWDQLGLMQQLKQARSSPQAGHSA
ncbi:MAG: ester cyclase [Acidobacteriia bacterium]|nr:ester cyclase [Terriglobia bacterium]